MIKKLFAILCLVSLVGVSCSKEEGKGGTNTIKGIVTVWEYNKSFTQKIGEYPGQDIDVYIVYGNDEVYGDRFQTGADGKYEFTYLREGNYTVYALSKDTNNLSTNQLVPVVKQVQVSGKNQVVEVSEIIVID